MGKKEKIDSEDTFCKVGDRTCFPSNDREEDFDSEVDNEENLYDNNELPSIYISEEGLSTEELSISSLPNREDYIKLYFGKEMNVLTDREIIELSKLYDIELERLCIVMANRLKEIILYDFGELVGKKPVALRTIFKPWDFGTVIRKVLKRENVTITKQALNKLKQKIIEFRNTQEADVSEYYEEIYNIIFSFIEEYSKFSEFIKPKRTSKVRISDIKFTENSNEVEVKSWLIENLRYAFPKNYEIPLDNNLLSWFLFNDNFGYGEQSIINFKLLKTEIYKRMEIRELLGVDYRISKLTVQNFGSKDIKITQVDLESLQQQVSFLIYYYIFYKEHNKRYVESTTSFGINVGKHYWTPEYFVIKAIFFAAAEANNGEIQDFMVIGVKSGVEKIQRTLRAGYGFGSSILDLKEYVKNLLDSCPPHSRKSVFIESMRTLDQYDSISYLRLSARRRELGGYDSYFEKDMHQFLLSEVSPLFTHHTLVSEAIDKRKIVLGSSRVISTVHHSLHYDFYFILNDDIREFLGLDNSWKAIAIEAQGSYWHGKQFPEHIRRDNFKRAISEQERIIQIDIWDNIEQGLWVSEIVRQFNEQTYANISEDDVLKLKEFAPF